MSLVTRLCLRMARLAPFVYLAAALPTVVFLTYLTPPSEGPDETNHFRRVVQLVRGQIVGQVVPPVESGGVIAKSAGDFAEALNMIIGHPEAKVDPSILRSMREIRWNRGDRAFDSFVNTVIYPPFFYLPALGAVAFGQAFDLSVYDSFALARLATGLSCVGIAALAIGLARRGRALLFVLLSLPMTLYLFACVTQDALLIASVALAAGLCSRAAGQGRPFTGPERLLVAVITGAAVAARPSYFPLFGLLLTSSVRPSGGTRGWSDWLVRLGPLALAVAIAAGWIVFGARPAKVPFRVSDGVSVTGQIDYLLHHLGAAAGILTRTLSGSGIWHYKQFIGVFGWSDTYLPDVYYPIATLALVIGAVLSFLEAGQTLRIGEGLWLFAGWIVAWAATYGILYLTWTKVGAATVDGVQGRYFLASSMLLVLALPALGSWQRQVRACRPGGGDHGGVEAGAGPFRNLAAYAGTASWTFVFLFAAGSDWFVPSLILARFYL